MTHRGPNDRGMFAAPGSRSAFAGLSIVDVAGGHQPFAERGRRVWAVQNGELYNHESIRDELEARGHRFRSRCDTEILPHLYEEVGDDVRRRGSAACSASPSGTGAGDGGSSRATGSASSRSTTRGAATCSSSRPSSRACSRAGSSSRARLRGDRRLPHARLRPGAADAARRRPEAAARAPSARRSSDGRARSSATGSTRCPTRTATLTSGRPAEQLLEELEEVGAPAADERRPARRDAQRRPRLEPASSR